LTTIVPEPRRRPIAAALPSSLRAVIAEEMPGAVSIVRDLLRRQHFDHAFALRLFAIARDGNESHELRCLAALALEHQFRLTQLPNREPFSPRGFLRGEKVPKADEGGRLAGKPMSRELLRAIGIDERVDQVSTRIARNETIHKNLRSGPAGLRAFLRHTRRECRLFFARYAFTPAEVVARIRMQTRTTPGKRDFPPLVHPCNVGEAAEAMAMLPAYEREIVRLLIESQDIYWVDESTPSSLNALVEYPAGAVVLVVKPPGSDLEIEIKRAGVRGPHAADICYRDESGAIVPRHHHLWGVSRGNYLRFEAANSALLTRVHRLALGTEAPIPRVVTLTQIESIPGGVSLLAHFDHPSRRESLLAALETVDRPELVTPPRYPARRFLEATTPSQAILVGTTSFRLDRLQVYLTDGVPFDGDAGELLDEIIDNYTPPPGPYDSHEQHVAAAFAHNRTAADRTYISILSQIGRFWGAALGMRAGSGGESFVTRNAGLRKVWLEGRWQVRFISMDHDGMNVAGRKQRHFNAPKDVNAFVLDLVHILGGPIGRRFFPGEIGALKATYRVSPSIASKGLDSFRTALRESYTRTLRAMTTDPRIRHLFHADFIDTIREWDRAVIDFVRNARDAESRLRWRRRTRTRLRRRGLPPQVIDQYVKTVLGYKDVLPWFVGMYESAEGAAKRSAVGSTAVPPPARRQSGLHS
jgi:hypothetical protein